MMQNGDMNQKTWILLNTCSTDSVTNNLDHVKGVKNHAKHKEIIVLTNGGSLIFDWKRCLTFLPLNVHVNKNDLAIIIPFKDVNIIPGVRVTMNTLI